MNQLISLNRLFTQARARTVLTYVAVGLLLAVAIAIAGRSKSGVVLHDMVVFQ